MTLECPLLLLFIVAMSIADIISARDYYDMVIFILKRMPRSHFGSILDVLHMNRKVMRQPFQFNLFHVKIHLESMEIIKTVYLQ
jgi:hypothetical protein